jgi:DNA-binding NarL/FixJ family response regulator
MGSPVEEQEPKANPELEGCSGRSAGKRRIFIVDDHPIFRTGILQLINNHPGLVVCGEAETMQEAVEEIDRMKPDLVVTDISLKGNSGIELIKSLHTIFPDIQTLVLSMHEESLYAERALRAGARGYVMKQEASESVLTAIEAVLGGGIYLSEPMNSALIRKLVGGAPPATVSPISILSDRELEIFQLIGRGVGTRQISDELHLGIKTVESHRANIKKKLGLKSAPALLRFAVEWIANHDA